MLITTADIYWKIVRRLVRTEKFTKEKAEKLVDKHETWLIDMVEAFGETKVPFLTNCILES